MQIDSQIDRSRGRQIVRYIYRYIRYIVILRDVRFVTKQPKNLQSILCSSKVRPAPGQVVEVVENPGTFKCGKKCHVCPRIKEGARFESTNTGRSYKSRVKCDGKSKFVVYLTTCRTVGLKCLELPHFSTAFFSKRLFTTFLKPFLKKSQRLQVKMVAIFSDRFLPKTF